MSMEVLSQNIVEYTCSLLLRGTLKRMFLEVPQFSSSLLKSKKQFGHIILRLMLLQSGVDCLMMFVLLPLSPPWGRN